MTLTSFISTLILIAVGLNKKYFQEQYIWKNGLGMFHFTFIQLLMHLIQEYFFVSLKKKAHFKYP